MSDNINRARYFLMRARQCKQMAQFHAETLEYEGDTDMRGGTMGFAKQSRSEARFWRSQARLTLRLEERAAYMEVWLKGDTDLGGVNLEGGNFRTWLAYQQVFNNKMLSGVDKWGRRSDAR